MMTPDLLMTTDWLDALHRLRQAHQAGVLVTVVAARGSTPREAGAKMVVAPDAVFGTIGGGNLEYRAIAIARDLLEDGNSDAPLSQEFPLGPALGQCCGGHASLLFEPVRPPGFRVAIFGAGHVGRALVRVLADLPCRVIWIDSRADAFPADIPANAVACLRADPAAEIPALPADAQIFIMTHDHAQDYAILVAALRQGAASRIGLIGSATKRARFLSRLRAEGLAAAAAARLDCPIGLPGVGGKLPAEIAIAVAAQLLQGHHARACQTGETTPPAAPLRRVARAGGARMQLVVGATPRPEPTLLSGASPGCGAPGCAGCAGE